MKNTSYQIRLIGLRFDPEYIEPDFYTLLLEERELLPISSDEQIIFFYTPDFAQKALELDSNFSKLESQIASKEVSENLDFASMFYLIAYECYDKLCCIVDCLNTLFDMLKAASIPIPPHYQRLLYPFADHLTFEQDFSAFLANDENMRNKLIEAIQWATGAIISKSTFFPKIKKDKNLE